MDLRKNGFWSAGRLAIGIISINLSILVSMYSCVEGVSAALSGDEFSVFVAFALAPCFLNAGIIGISTRNSRSIIGPIVSTVIYWISTLFMFGELPELGIVSFLFGTVFLFCAVKTKKQELKIMQELNQQECILEEGTE